MNADTLIPRELCSQMQGAFAILCALLVLVTLVAMFFAFLARRRRASKADQQALTLGRLLIEEFNDDYAMAWAEYCRIRAENRIVKSLAAAEERRARKPTTRKDVH